jgi:hypothetical protein
VLESGSLAMKFILGGKESELVTGDVLVNGEYLFTFTNIPPQCMSDNISATVYLVDANGEIVSTLAKKSDYSIKVYAQSVLTNYAHDENLVQLVSDMLHYGATAQVYRDNNLGNLANVSVFGIKDQSGSVPADTDFDLPKPASQTLYFTSAGVRFDYMNNLYVTVSTKENARLVIKVNGVVVNEITELDGTTVYTDPINATSFNDVYTFELYEGETLAQTLTYSIKSYVYEMMNKTDANGEPTKMAALARALYAYGESAVAVRGEGN